MAQKQDVEFFKDLKQKPFNEYMEMYSGLLHEFNQMMIKALESIELGENPSKNHAYKMRQKTIDIEKFGKQFRERTIEIEKNR